MFWLDTAMVLVLGMGAVIGAMTGFVWQVARILSLAAALYASIFVNEWATELVHDLLLQGADLAVAKGLAYALVFVAVYLVLYCATRLLYHGIRAVDLEGLDRLLGALVGVAKMAIILSGFSFCLSTYSHPQTQELLDRSILAPALAEGMQYVLVAIPQEYKDDLSNSLKNLREWARSKSGSRKQEAGSRNQEAGIGHPEPAIRLQEGGVVNPEAEIRNVDSP